MSRVHHRVALLLAAVVAMVSASCSPPIGPSSAQVQILSVYWGADNSINAPADQPGELGAVVPGPICPAAVSADGVPVTFDARVDPGSVGPGDFDVNGVTPLCATVLPAIEPNELFTVLLIGQFADSALDSDTVLTVTATGLVTTDGRTIDATATSSPFASGETIVIAEQKRAAPGPGLGEWQRSPADAFVAAYDVGDDQCPAGTTDQVRVVFDGGITDADGPATALDAGDLADFTISTPSGPSAPPAHAFAPIAFGDQFAPGGGPDQDNFLDLCLDRPLPTGATVTVAAGTVTDPSGVPNRSSTRAIATVDER